MCVKSEGDRMKIQRAFSYLLSSGLDGNCLGLHICLSFFVVLLLLQL